jgi:hypothetical protein
MIGLIDTAFEAACCFEAALELGMLAAWIYDATYGKRARWRRAGRCARRGYDLTGNTSGLCPECGTPIG